MDPGIRYRRYRLAAPGASLERRSKRGRHQGISVSAPAGVPSTIPGSGEQLHRSRLHQVPPAFPSAGAVIEIRRGPHPYAITRVWLWLRCADNVPTIGEIRVKPKRAPGGQSGQVLSGSSPRFYCFPNKRYAIRRALGTPKSSSGGVMILECTRIIRSREAYSQGFKVESDTSKSQRYMIEHGCGTLYHKPSFETIAVRPRLPRTRYLSRMMLADQERSGRSRSPPLYPRPIPEPSGRPKKTSCTAYHSTVP